MTKCELVSFRSPDELANHVAGLWLDEIESSNRAGKPHCVALSGGRIAQKLFTAVVGQAKSRNISFATVQFFWADERCVPPLHPDSNFRLANDTLLEPLKISDDTIHRLQGDIAPRQAAQIASSQILKVARVSAANLPVLDLILLGMGEDGHVASLFPNASEETLNCAEPFLSVDNSPKPPANRLSLSYPAIASATNVWVLASGAGKKDALEQSIKPAGTTPLAKVVQMRDNTKIFSDIC